MEMATLTEEKIMNLTADKQAELHNAQIAERYRRLQDAEADQFASETHNQAKYAVRASVLTPEAPAIFQTPVTEQTPQVTEFVRERIENPVFTTEKFERATENAPVAVKPVEIPMQAVSTTTAVATAEEYSLSRMAKMVMAVFATVVVMMLTLICINTQIIQNKSMQLRNLERQREELVERNEEISRRIENAKSEETIKEYALSQGMIQG